MMSEHLKRELECDAHNMQEACNLMVGKYNKSVAKYMRNLKKTILMQRKTLKG